MRLFKISILFAFLVLFCLSAGAQDMVLISDGNFVKGTIRSTNFSSVILVGEDESFKEFFAKDIKEFVWNGQTYVSKPIVVKKKMEHRFFKLVEYGAVNLYAFGGSTAEQEVVQAKRPRIRPNVGVGMGTGGIGSGLGGGIAIDLGGGRRAQETVAKPKLPSIYFIERLGSPMQQVPLNSDSGQAADTTPQAKTILLQKMINSEEMKTKIQSANEIDEKTLISLVKEYNQATK